MESHEWFENTAEGKVYYRGNYLGGKWTIMTTTQKRDPTWTDISPVSEAIWRDLRDIVWKKYQRKRCPWERVADLDKILGDLEDVDLATRRLAHPAETYSAQEVKKEPGLS